MGIRKHATARDFYPLKEACRTSFLLNAAERRVPEKLQWHYEIMADRKRPSFAAIVVYDETLAIRGVWYK